MRIAFIYPSDNLLDLTTSTQERVQSKHFGRYPHLGLAILAACLEKANHEVIIIDGNRLGLSYKQILDKLHEFKPALLGLTATTPNFPYILNCIKQLKKDLNIPIVVGGLHFSLYPRESLSHKEIDFIIMGEGINSLPKLVNALSKNKKSFKHIEGLGYRSSNKIIINKQGKEIKDLDKIPWPARHLFPKDGYFNFLTRKENYTPFFTQWGCPGKCIFCDRGNNRIAYRTRSAKNILEEIKYCYEHLGVREIMFYDVSFTTNRKKIIDLCNLLIKNKLKIDWSCSARADLVDEELLNLMKKAGCRRIQYGIETVNSIQAPIIKKEETKETIEKSLRLTRKAGISILCYFMLGLPGDTEETMEENVRYALSLDIDYASFTLTTAYPNTTLHEKQTKEAGYDFWSLYTLGKIPSSQRLELYGTDLTVKRVQEKIREAYIRFYFRPSQISRILKDANSLLQIKRYISAAINIGLLTGLYKLKGLFGLNRQKPSLSNLN